MNPSPYISKIITATLICLSCANLSPAGILFQDGFESPPETVGAAPSLWTANGTGVNVVADVLNGGVGANSLLVRGGVERRLELDAPINIEDTNSLTISWIWRQNNSFEASDGLKGFAVDFGNGYETVLVDMGVANGTNTSYDGTTITLENDPGNIATPFISYSVTIDSSYYTSATTMKLRYTTYSGVDAETSNFDNITVTAVPEAETLGLLLMGFTILIFARRKAK
ncbi:hypothetical protein P3T73_09310 [Kiritimatiellota bacterium B12222]|nr:hypothetical protein P3T73_09310 [Kiritimatiellota bacterium B12222]